MPTVRLNAFFKDDDGHGWSEQHDKDGGSSVTSLTSFLAAFNTLMQSFRRPLLAGDAYYIGCRASYPTVSGAVAGDNIELDPPMRGPLTFGGASLGMSAPEAAVKMRFRNDASTARSDVYVRGMWSQVITAGVLDFGSPEGSEWKRRADAYAAALLAGGYGWQGVNPALTSRGRVTNYEQNADGTVTVSVIATNAVLLPAIGQRVTMNFSRINGSKSVLNRSFACIVGPLAGQVTTTELVSVSPFATEGHYIAVVLGFIPYAALSYYRLTHRKTGRPFGVAPGRRRAATLH